MKKTLLLGLSFMFAGFGYAQQNSAQLVSSALVRAVNRSASAVCQTESCFKKAVEKGDFRLVENTLKRFEGTAFGADLVHLRFEVKGKAVTLPEYLVANGKIAQARRLFEYYYLYCSRYDATAQGDDGVDNLLEKLVFAKGNPARVAFARELLSKYTTVAISKRTLQYALTMANDSEGFAYVQLLLTKPVGGINTSQRDRMSYPTPYALSGDWFDMRDVLDNELKFTKDPEEIKWLHKTREFILKKGLY